MNLSSCFLSLLLPQSLMRVTSAFISLRSPYIPRLKYQNRSCQSKCYDTYHLSTLKSASSWRVCLKRKKSTLPGSRLFSNNNTPEPYSLNIYIPTAQDMEDIGGLLSVGSRKGDVIFLDGDLGAGKTCFARGFIRGRTGQEDERVTSPTYLLSNSYPVDNGSTKIYHMDLYRLSSEKTLLALDLDNVFSNAISLIEWPSRLGKMAPQIRLDVTVTVDSEDESDDIETKLRIMSLKPKGEQWVDRIKFLESEGYFEDLIVDASES